MTEAFQCLSGVGMGKGNQLQSGTRGQSGVTEMLCVMACCGVWVAGNTCPNSLQFKVSLKLRLKVFKTVA